jgi:predicted HTH domain antitoxin
MWGCRGVDCNVCSFRSKKSGLLTETETSALVSLLERGAISIESAAEALGLNLSAESLEKMRGINLELEPVVDKTKPRTRQFDMDFEDF